MRKILRGHLPSPAMLVAFVAVVLATSGTAFAASALITSKNIKDGTIQSRDLSKSLRAQIAKAGKPGKSGTNGTNGAAGQNGAAGAKGDAGSKGENGAAGTNGTNGTSGINGADGAAGAKGDTGDTGAKGDKGDTGDTGAVGPVGPQGPQGSSGALPPGFSVWGNTPPTLTSEGVEFGPMADAGTQYGSIYYDRLNGMKLSDIANLVYKAKFTTSDSEPVAVPYLRVFLNGDTTDVAYSPNTQDAPDIAEGVVHTWDVPAGTVRYNDDDGDGLDDTSGLDTGYGINGSAWDTVVADHGDDVISGIYVTVGASGGHDVDAFLSDMTINAKSFHFGQG